MSTTRRRPSRTNDLAELREIAPELREAQAKVERLIERRRVIFARRVAAGDCTKVELAQAADTTRLNVVAALKPGLVKAPRRSRARVS